MTATGAGAGPPARDLSSLSNPDEARVTHLSWDAVVDFEREQFFAQATYDVTLLPAGAGDGPARSLYLDTSGLDVRAVHVNGAPATFSLSVPDPSKPHLGSRLAVSLGASPGAVAAGATAASVRIQYVTSRTASAAQWLPPAQTAGKRHPYVFSACFVSRAPLAPAAPPDRSLCASPPPFPAHRQRNARPSTPALSCRARTVPRSK